MTTCDCGDNAGVSVVFCAPRGHWPRTSLVSARLLLGRSPDRQREMKNILYVDRELGVFGKKVSNISWVRATREVGHIPGRPIARRLLEDMAVGATPREGENAGQGCGDRGDSVGRGTMSSVGCGGVRCGPKGGGPPVASTFFLRAATQLATLALVLAMSVPLATANAPQDLFGVGSREIAMGGTGVASSLGHTSAYYNPANLAFCPVSSVTLSTRRANYNLPVTTDSATIETDVPARRTGIDFGGCVHGPLRLSFGFLFSAGLESPQRLDEFSVNGDPRYPIYGTKQDMLSILGGWAFRPIDEVSIGVGAAVLVNSGLVLNNNIPVVTEGEEVTNAIGWDLQPRIAPYVGLHVQPVPMLDLGLVYRGALYHKLEATAYTAVEVAGVDLQVDLLLESVAWYSPQQVAFGAAFRPIPELQIAMDVTWFDWSSDPGPFIVATPVGEGAVAQSLDYPHPYTPAYRDITQPRLGLEYTLNEVIDFRAGYTLRPWIVPFPDPATNLLDGDAHTFSVGSGYHFTLPSDPWAGDDATPPARTNRVDAHLARTTMTEHEIVREQETEVLDGYTFGGSIFEAGVTVTLGW